MIQKMLEYYNSELAYLREAGTQFGKHYPKIASRLAINESEVADPYVERLLEGFSFLAARIKLKMDAEFPHFIQRLIEVTYPNYLAPTPSMCIIRFAPGELVRNQSGSYLIPRGSRLRSNRIMNHSYCEFRTAHEVELLPLDIVHAGFSPITADLLGLLSAKNKTATYTLKLRFTLSNEIKFNKDTPDQIPIHLNADLQLASRLYETIMGHHVAVAIRAINNDDEVKWFFNAHSLEPLGFDTNQSLLPYAENGFQGYRLLHEYFSLPGRFHFFSLNHIKRFLSENTKCRHFEVAILLDNAAPEFEKIVDVNHFSLFCSPAVNLINMRSDRVPVSDKNNEFHLVPNREHPLDYEVYSVISAEGFDRDHRVQQQFRPFFATHAEDRSNHGAYFSMRREPRMASEHILNNGSRSTYLGSEVFISLVDQRDAPFDRKLRQLGVDIVATNRDLPLLMQTGTDHDLRPVASLPVDGVKIICGPTKPVPAIEEGHMHWRFISHLKLSYQSLAQPDPIENAVTLRELLGLYSALGNSILGNYNKGIIKCSLQQVTRRLPGQGPLIFGRGTAIHIEIDEIPFAGASPYILGAVLERYLAQQAGINSFSELKITSAQRGLIAHWPARFGERGNL